MISHHTEYGVYHWDTFDNETFLKYQHDDLDDCKKWIANYYGKRVRNNGADQVRIVDKGGNIIERYSVI